MIIKLVKWVEVNVDASSVEEAMDMVDALDSEGSLEMVANYYDESDVLLN